MSLIESKGWWASKSTGAKAGIIFGITVIIGGIVFVTWHFNKDNDKNSKSPNPDQSGDETESESSALQTGQNVPSQTSQAQYTASKLPNNGKGCSEVRTNFDLDFDYVKCDGVWYTKSKENPKNQRAKGYYKDWVSLEKNKVATDRLNRRYQ